MKRTILIIEDSYTSLVLMQDTFRLEGYETQLAVGVKEAIELINKKIPDLIILDLNMPDISGYDFLGMKKQLKIERIPVVVVSALDSPESIQRAKDLGASEFIRKPVKLKLVIEKVKALIDQA